MWTLLLLVVVCPAVLATQFCNNGPYVFDESQHLEGIGSTFNYHKQALVLADKINAQWIGSLTNEHDVPLVNRDNYFGLQSSDCNASLLDFYRRDNTSGLVFKNQQRSFDFQLEHLCAPSWHFGKYYRQKYGSDRNAVYIVNQVEIHEDFNYCTFSKKFRRRFFNRQRGRRPLRPKNETWISMQFRWGDVSNGLSVEFPNKRSAYGLTRMATLTRTVLDTNPDARVFLLTEGQKKEFRPFLNVIPTAEIISEEKWQDSLWRMSESNVLIGGTSQFFKLGAHLCKECFVVTTTNSKKNFDFLLQDETPNHHEIIYMPSRSAFELWVLDKPERPWIIYVSLVTLIFIIWYFN